MSPLHDVLGSWPDDLEASTTGCYIPIWDACQPDDLGSRSLVMTLRNFRRDGYVGLVLVLLVTMFGGGFVLVKLWLISSWGSSSTGFTCSTLTSVLYLKNSRQSNQQTNNVHDSREPKRSWG